MDREVQPESMLELKVDEEEQLVVNEKGGAWAESKV